MAAMHQRGGGGQDKSARHGARVRGGLHRGGRGTRGSQSRAADSRNARILRECSRAVRALLRSTTLEHVT